MAVLADVAVAAPPGSWVGAGAVRDVVWDQRFGPDGAFDPGRVKDVDVGFFDPADLSPERDADVEAALRRRRPDVRWDAKNQAAVHLWYPARFDVEVCAPHGLDDLLDGVWRRNPARVTEAEYRRRLAAKRPRQRWPGVRVAPDANAANGLNVFRG